MTQVTLYSSTEFQYKTWSPFSRVPGNVESTRTSPPGPPEGLLRAPDLIPPLWAIIVKLVSRITPSPLNRFLRFQLRCISLENIFPAIYNTSGYDQGIPRKSM